MSARLLVATSLLLTLAGPVLTALPAAAQDPAKAELFERRLGRTCRPPFKFAAGACVRVCPAGYEDNGPYCRLRNQSDGNRGW